MDTIVSVTFVCCYKNNETMKQIMLIIGCVCLCIVISDGVVDFLVKPLVGRFRPSHDPLIKYSIDVVDGMRSTSYGFFPPMLQIRVV